MPKKRDFFSFFGHKRSRSAPIEFIFDAANLDPILLMWSKFEASTTILKGKNPERKKRIIIIYNTITIYFQTSTKFENLIMFNAIKIRYIFKLLTNNRISSDLFMFYECHVTFWCCHVTKQEVLDIFEIKS